MIPYFQIPSLFGLIHSFGVLVATGILLGAYVVRVRGRQIGLDDFAASSVSTWVVLVGFIIGHIFDVVAYQPDTLAERWHAMFDGDGLYGLGRFLFFLLSPTAGLSSFGGFFGALVGLIAWSRHYRQPIWPFADSLIFGLAPGWTFGRLGCFTAHDHPGAHTDFFLAVQYPDGARHDLGLYEALFAAALTGLFFILYRKPRRIGTYLAIACLVYAPVRFGFDFLRTVDLAGADPRYFGLTPAQYGAIALFLGGVVFAWRAARSPTQAAQPAPLPAAQPERPSDPPRKKRSGRPG